MTNKTKDIEEAAKLPTAEQVLSSKEPNREYPCYYHTDDVLDAMEVYAAAHTAGLREELKETQNIADASTYQLKRLVEKYDNLMERVKEQNAKIASYESAIDGLKKVVDSLYNLK